MYYYNTIGLNFIVHNTLFIDLCAVTLASRDRSRISLKRGANSAPIRGYLTISDLRAYVTAQSKKKSYTNLKPLMTV